MTRFRIAFVLAALVATSGSARAQRWGGSPAHGADRRAAAGENRPTAPSTWNGTVSSWGGSPIETRDHFRQRSGYLLSMDGYFPYAVAAPAPVPATYVVDTVYVAARQAPVEMPVVTSRAEPPTPTTMDVYRQQARFRKP